MWYYLYITFFFPVCVLLADSNYANIIPCCTLLYQIWNWQEFSCLITLSINPLSFHLGCELCCWNTAADFASYSCLGRGLQENCGEDRGTASTARRTHIYLFAGSFLWVIEPSRDFTERMKFCGQSDYPLDAFENILLYWYCYYSNI